MARVAYVTHGTARIVPDPEGMARDSSTWRIDVDNDVLRQAPLFSSLDDEAATALGGSMAETTLRRGDVLFHEGDSGDSSTSSPRAR